LSKPSFCCKKRFSVVFFVDSKAYLSDNILFERALTGDFSVFLRRFIMPPRRRQQTAGMLYTLIISIGFLIAFIAAAVIFYVKAEDYRTRLDTSQREINDLATNTERQRIGAIVGAKQTGKSRLGSMVDYLDRMASLIIGGVPEDTSAMR